MMFFGPQPNQKVIEDRPEDVSLEAAVTAWAAGYTDGRTEATYHVFPEDSQDLQPLYSHGYERGERDRLHMTRVAERVPEGGFPGGADSAAGARTSQSFWARVSKAARRSWSWFQSHLGVLMFFAVLGLIAALWRSRG